MISGTMTPRSIISKLLQPKDNTDDIFTDVVDITFDSGKQTFPLEDPPAEGFGGFDVWCQVLATDCSSHEHFLPPAAGTFCRNQINRLRYSYRPSIPDDFKRCRS